MKKEKKKINKTKIQNKEEKTRHPVEVVADARITCRRLFERQSKALQSSVPEVHIACYECINITYTRQLVPGMMPSVPPSPR